MQSLMGKDDRACMGHVLLGVGGSVATINHPWLVLVRDGKADETQNLFDRVARPEHTEYSVSAKVFNASGHLLYHKAPFESFPPLIESSNFALGEGSQHGGLGGIFSMVARVPKIPQ